MSVETLLQTAGFTYCEEAVVSHLSKRLRHEEYATLQERLYFLHCAAREWSNDNPYLFLTLPVEQEERLCVLTAQGTKIAWLEQPRLTPCT